jgi:hypothetical protein
MNEKTSWKPTRKWLARTIIGAIGGATMYVLTGSWDQEESIALLTLAGGASTSYLLPNEPSNDGTETPLT